MENKPHLLYLQEYLAVKWVADIYVTYMSVASKWNGSGSADVLPADIGVAGTRAHGKCVSDRQYISSKWNDTGKWQDSKLQQQLTIRKFLLGELFNTAIFMYIIVNATKWQK
jgi:hypothetical protein